jgi:hypothetical protein
MLYVVVITLLLSGAALAAEHAARLRRARSRWIWAVTIVASLIIPTVIASVTVQVPSLLTPTVSRLAIPLRDLTSVQVVPLAWVHEHTRSIVAAHSENLMLQRTWIAVSGAVFTGLVLNGLYLVWRKRRWGMKTVAGVYVYIAPDVGPAVVGLLRPRIVVPEWLEEASSSRQGTVIAHEQSHLEAHDPQLLTVALFLLVLMPWNLPLWWQLHRLRYAIEVDCDARVLKAGLDTNQYGETLIAVSQRQSGYIGAVAAMSESRSFLEERITIMVKDRAEWDSLAALIFGCLALALAVVAAQVTPPNVGSSASARPVHLTSDVLDQYVGFYARGSHLVFTLRRDGAQLVKHVPAAPGFDTIKLVLNGDGEFVGLRGSLHTFVLDEQGQVMGVIIKYGLVSVPMQRIDASTAQTILTNNELRLRSQVRMPGSEAALRRLIDGFRSGKPNYDEMSPWFAELVRKTMDFNRVYARRGAVQSIEFRHVDLFGSDVYEVRQEGGLSEWAIFLDSNGLIEDADNTPFG